MFETDPSAIQAVCSKCKTPVSSDACNTGNFFPCSGCGKMLRVELFPAIAQPAISGSRGENILAEGESSCFYHPQKRAAALCSVCGRFLCKLCEIELSGCSICPACLESGRQNEEIEALVTSRTLHDRIALNVAILPLFLWPITIISAPIAIFLAIKNWNKPGSLLQRSHFRMAAAIIIALLEIAGLIVLATALLSRA